MENSTNERILEEDRCLIKEYIERPGGDIIEDYANAQVGDLFRFGCYPQGPSGEVEPIIWRVLKRDSDGLLVISEKGLDCKHYNKQCVSITWADCTLRRWLNGEFLEQAFSEQEQSLIKTKTIENNAGPATKDRIFLLSVGEVTSLFANGKDRTAKSTEYATKKMVHIQVVVGDGGKEVLGGGSVRAATTVTARRASAAMATSTSTTSSTVMAVLFVLLCDSLSLHISLHNLKRRFCITFHNRSPELCIVF